MYVVLLHHPLSRVFKFSERPGIVPPEIFSPQRPCTGSLAEDGKTYYSMVRYSGLKAI
jgi:hypothetical protein